MTRRKGFITFFSLILIVVLFIYVINRLWLNQLPSSINKIESKKVLRDSSVNKDYGEMETSSYQIRDDYNGESLSTTAYSQVSLSDDWNSPTSEMSSTEIYESAIEHNFGGHESASEDSEPDNARFDFDSDQSEDKSEDKLEYESEENSEDKPEDETEDQPEVESEDETENGTKNESEDDAEDDAEDKAEDDAEDDAEENGSSVIEPKTLVQSMILSSGRSGSTFLGEVLHSLPGSYYNFESLMYLNTLRIRDSYELSDGLRTLRHVLHCNYTGLDDYFNSEGFDSITQHNKPLRNSCQNDESQCSDQKFLNAFCPMFPYQITKEVRLPAKHSELLLSDPESNLKILLLIRDPRGVMHSRNQEEWYLTYPECASVSKLCEDMVEDFKAAKLLVQRFPQRFSVVRYKELAKEPFDMTEKILKFYGLPFNDQVIEYLDSHTEINEARRLSIFGDSKTTPFRWTTEMSYDQIQEIQSECKEAMDLWGYKNVLDENTLKYFDFEPLLEFPFSIDGFESTASD